MPLKGKGNRIRSSFRRRYGKSGDRVFYATLVKNRKLARKVEPRGSKVLKAANSRYRRTHGKKKR